MLLFFHPQVSSTLLTAALSAWSFTMLLGRKFLAHVKKLGLQQPYNPELPLHLSKAGTPTSGGLFFVLGASIPTVLLGAAHYSWVLILLTSMWLFAAIGFFDDLLKARKSNSPGFTTLQKLLLQIVVAFALVLVIVSQESFGGLTITFGNFNLYLGLWYIPLATIFVVTFVNAVNITDGLDGLATINALPVLLLMLAALFSFNSIQELLAEQSYPIAVAIASLGGALVAFLWYNLPQAQVFMGDSGSHAIGAFIAIAALILKLELLIVLASLIFIIECCSSLVQIIAVRVFKRRVLLIAPLHHHFELKGVSERTIVMRMSLVGLLGNLAALYFIFRQ